MSRVDTFKLALALCAIILFGWGIHTDNNPVRWAGVACLAAAVILRFVFPRRNGR